MRTVVRTIEALLLAALFSVALLVGVVLHLDVPAGRRLTARTLSDALDKLFYGEVHIGRITHFDPYSVVAADVVVRDPSGKQVLHVSRLVARANIPDIVEDLLFDTGKVDIVIRYVRVEDAEGEILPDPSTGVPTIARAFTLRKAPPTAPSAPPSKGPAREIRVWLPQIEVGRAYARGTIAGLPTMEAQLANVGGSVLVTPKGVAVDVKRFGTTVRGLGGADAKGTGMLHIRAPGAIWTGFDGYFGDVEVGAFARIDKNRLTASVDLPRARPEAVRALLPDYPIHQSLGAHVDVSGTLPVLATKTRLEIGNAVVTAEGPLRLSGTVGANLDVQAKNVDLRALFPAAPESNLSATSSVSIWNKSGQVVVDVNGTSQPGTIAGQDIPAVDVVGTYNEHGFKGVATAHERGLPLKAEVAVAKNGDVDVDARARSFRIQGAPRLAHYTKATGVADVRVTAHIAGSRIDANVTGDFHSLALGQVRLGTGHLSGHAAGPLAHPEKLAIDARLRGRELHAGAFSFGQVQASAVGPVRRPRVKTTLEDEYGPKITASGLVSTVGKPSIHDLQVEVRREAAALEGRIAELDLGAGTVDVEKLHLTGAGGDLDGSAHIGPSTLTVEATGHDLDLDVISRALGLPRGVLGGKLRIDADVSAGRDTAQGKIRIGLGNGSVMGFEGISLDAHADLDGKRFSGGASVLLKDFGAFGALWDTELAGPLQKLASWKKITGQANVQMSGVSLDGLERALPKSLRISQVTGQAAGQVRVDRHSPDALPSVSALMETKKLEVVREPAAGSDAEPQTVKGVDVQVGGTVNGETGDTWLTTRLVYDQSVLASATATTKLDLRKIVAAPSALAGQILQTPVDAVLTVDKREIAAFPPILQLPDLAGAVGGRVTLSGPPASAVLGATIDAEHLVEGGSRYAAPVDVHASARYERSTGLFGGTAEASVAGRRVAQLVTRGTAKWSDLLAQGNLDHPRWTGGGQLVFERMPLGVVGALADARVGGELNGTFALQRNDQLPQIAGNVQVGGMSINGTAMGVGHLSMRSDGEHLVAGVRFDKGSGSLDVSARAALAWAGVIPRIDRARPVVLGADAKQFDAVVLQPLLSDILSELGGDVDGHVTATLTSNDKDEWDANIAGTAEMKNGVVQLAALGLSLDDVSFRAGASRVGHQTVINIDDIKAKARSDKQNLAGRATLYLSGLRVVSGNADLAASPAAPVPVLVEGVTLASVDTRGHFVHMELRREPDRMQVDISVPHLLARLPKAQTRSVQDLGDNPDIAIAEPLSEPTAPRSSTALPWSIAFSLGDDVRVARSDIEIPVGGEPSLELGKAVAVRGYVTLRPGGRVPALGHVFVIDGGRVTFDTDEASNPHVDATASWRSPEGTTVHATIQGRFQEATIRLTSDPPLPEPEIMALLLGGGPAGAGGGPSGGALAAGAASSLGLYDLLSNTPLSNVQFSAGSRENQYGTSNTAYTAAVRVSDEVWLEGTYEQAGGVEKSDPNTAAPAFSAAVDWRFHQNWSLRTEAGTATTALDLLWSYRY